MHPDGASDTLGGAQKRPHHLQFAEIFRSLNLGDELRCIRPQRLPCSISTVYFTTVLPGFLNGALTFTLELGYKLHSTDNCGEPVKSVIAGLKLFSLYLATKRCVFMPSELGGRREIDLLRPNNIRSDCKVCAFS